jgi:hypothetical protein
MQSESNYWFPAGRYGWGWGLPVRWQGWLVLAAFAGCSWLVLSSFGPRLHPFSILLMSSCWTRCLSACVGSLASLHAGGGGMTNIASKSAHVDTI